MTIPAPATPTTPTHDPRAMERTQPSASAATITTSHPLLGPCVPSRRTGPSLHHGRKTATAATASATQAIRRVVGAPDSRRVACGRMRRETSTGSGTRRVRRVLAIAGLVAAAAFVLVFRQVLGITQRPSWPPPSDAVTPARARAATEAFAAQNGTRPHDATLDFAWSTAATIDPWPEGANFFPRIFDDVEAARSSVHILMFGWREGNVGKRLAALLKRKLAEGVAGPGDRRQLRLPAVCGRACDVHRPRRGGRADRHQRRVPARPGRPVPGRSDARLAAGRGRPRRPPQALCDRRGDRLDGRGGHRGPLRERRLPRRHGQSHR